MSWDSFIGARIGRWSVLSKAPARKGKRYFSCLCLCGTLKDVSGSSLAYGQTSSCGCYRAENPPRKTHGKTRSPTHNSWASMHQRCSPLWRERQFYHDRGITICGRWSDFSAFLEDMGERPEGTTLDRIDNDKGYESANCRWATPKQQANNRRARSKPGRGAGARVEIEAA